MQRAVDVQTFIEGTTKAHVAELMGVACKMWKPADVKRVSAAICENIEAVLKASFPSNRFSNQCPEALGKKKPKTVGFHHFLSALFAHVCVAYDNSKDGNKPGPSDSIWSGKFLDPIVCVWIIAQVHAVMGFIQQMNKNAGYNHYCAARWCAEHHAGDGTTGQLKDFNRLLGCMVRENLDSECGKLPDGSFWDQEVQPEAICWIRKPA